MAGDWTKDWKKILVAVGAAAGGAAVLYYLLEDAPKVRRTALATSVEASTSKPNAGSPPVAVACGMNDVVGLRLTEVPVHEQIDFCECDLELPSPQVMQLPVMILSGTDRKAVKPVSQEKELAVESTSSEAKITWMVDMKNLRARHKNGFSTSFTVKVCNSDIRFLLMLVPYHQASDAAAHQRKVATFKDRDAQAKVQLKRTGIDVSPTDANWMNSLLLDVAFVVGDQEVQIKRNHDFSAEPLCISHGQEGAWKLPEVLQKCMVSVTITPSSVLEALPTQYEGTNDDWGHDDTINADIEYQ